MSNLFFVKSIMCSLWLFPIFSVFSLEENFLVIDGKAGEVLISGGPNIDKRASPCCSFNIALSLMGYDSGILQDKLTPTWDFKQGYDDYRLSWKQSMNPTTWMQYSCVWYSKLLAKELGVEKLQGYLDSIEYGNRDLSGISIKDAPWLNSSILISVREQVEFVKKMIQRKLRVSDRAILMTKEILFKEELPGGWKLYGKTGGTGSDVTLDGQTLEHGWFVGWIEKEGDFFPFAYLIHNDKLMYEEMVPRFKQILEKSNVYEK